MDVNSTLIIFPAWQSLYQYIGPLSGYGIPTSVILAGYWSQAGAGLKIAFLVASGMQILLALVGLSKLLWTYWLKPNTGLTEKVRSVQPVTDPVSFDLEQPGSSQLPVDLAADDSVDTDKILATLTSTVRVVIPTLLFSWQVVVGLIGLTVPLLQLSSASAAFIFIHALLEFTILVLRIMVLRDITQAKLNVAITVMVVIYGVLVLLYLCIGDIYYHSALGGLSLPSDIGNFVIGPFASAYMWYTKGPSVPMGRFRLTNGKLFIIDLASVIVTFTHVLIFYPTALAAALGHLTVAASLAVAFIWLNLIGLSYYVMVV